MKSNSSEEGHRRFEVLPHTADKGVKVYGRTIEELFENAAYAMFSLMAELCRYQPSQERSMRLEASDTRSLLRIWLAELLYEFEVGRILFVDFEVSAITEGRLLEGKAWGVPFDSEIEWLGPSVKAVTHHDLFVHFRQGQWEAQIIFDV